MGEVFFLDFRSTFRILSVNLSNQNNQRVVFTGCCCFSFFPRGHTGLSTRPPHPPKAETENGPQRSKDVRNKFAIRNWKVTGKTEMELIASILVSTAQEGGNCPKSTDERILITWISLSNSSLQTTIKRSLTCLPCNGVCPSGFHRVE